MSSVSDHWNRCFQTSAQSNMVASLLHALTHAGAVGLRGFLPYRKKGSGRNIGSGSIAVLRSCCRRVLRAFFPRQSRSAITSHLRFRLLLPILVTSFPTWIYHVCLIRCRAMRFVIRARSPECAPIRVDGTWTVEAATREEAVALMESHISLLPEGATWTIRPWTPCDGEPSACKSLAKPTAAA